MTHIPYCGAAPHPGELLHAALDQHGHFFRRTPVLAHAGAVWVPGTALFLWSDALGRPLVGFARAGPAGMIGSPLNYLSAAGCEQGARWSPAASPTTTTQGSD